jgi:hypothetical protein
MLLIQVHLHLILRRNIGDVQRFSAVYFLLPIAVETLDAYSFGSWKVIHGLIDRL